jgi:hypothetical protein
MNNEVPTFAVVGRVNMGKSAVIATLREIDDNTLIRVSSTPGETTRCQVHPVIFDGREFLRFIDTPGFSRPIEAMRAIQQIHGPGTPGPASLRTFLNQPGDDFGDERRLLAPLLDGAGVLYVVDPGRPLRDDFLAEMEILRWTGQPRLAVLNRRDPSPGPDEDAWRTHLGATFNLVRSFDAHRARYDERLRLLRALLEIEERHRPVLEQTIQLVERDWQQRREVAAEILIDFLQAALGLRVTATLEERDALLESRRNRKAEQLAQRYYQELAELERHCFERLLGVYLHRLLKAEARDEAFVGIDLQSAETWSKWGLSRAQLTLVAAITGGAAGVMFDLSTGGLSHGLGTVVGALGSGAAAWFKGGSLPDLRMTSLGGVKLASGEGRALTLGPPRSSNFPWVLLDGVLLRYQAILSRAHGRRDEEILSAHAAPEAGFTRNFPGERRTLLAKWFAGCLAGRPDPSLEPEVFAALVAALGEAANP